MSFFDAALVLVAAQAVSASPPDVLTASIAATAEEMELGRAIARASPSVPRAMAKAMAEVALISNDNPDLSLEDKMRLREVGIREFKALYFRTIEAEARAYVDRLSLDELRSLAAEQKSLAAAGRREPSPTVDDLVSMKIERNSPFAASVRTAFCAETGKLCQ